MIRMILYFATIPERHAVALYVTVSDHLECIPSFEILLSCEDKNLSAILQNIWNTQMNIKFR